MAIRIIIHMHTNLVHVAIIMMHQVSYLHKVYINYAAHMPLLYAVLMWIIQLKHS